MIAALIAALLSLLNGGHADSGHPLPGSTGSGPGHVSPAARLTIQSGHPLPGGAPVFPIDPLRR